MLKDYLVKLRNKIFGVNAILSAVDELKSEIVHYQELVKSSPLQPIPMIETTTDLGNPDELIPPLEYCLFIGGGDYKAIGDRFLKHLIELCGIAPHHQVLDAGSGVGRMARPLTQYLSAQGGYWGFDIFDKGIDWCVQNYRGRYPNFHFDWADVYNLHYNPSGKYKAKEYKFPYADGQFDIIFSTSLFTHMLLPDLENYLREMSRVLKPQGKCLNTFFVMTDEAYSLMQKNAGSPGILNFPYLLDQGCFTVDLKMPETTVAYDPEIIQQLHQSCGLKIDEPIRYGSWCGRSDFFDYQDVVVATKS